jgi:acyl-CoA dehydrogenase
MMNDNLVFDAACKVFDDLAPAALKLAEAGQAPQQLWNAFNDAGFAEALVDDGWSGVTDAIAILRAAGRAAAPGPFVERMLACKLAVELKLNDEASGKLGIVLAAFAAPKHLGDAVIAPWPQQHGHVIALMPTGWAQFDVSATASTTHNYAGEPQQVLPVSSAALKPYPPSTSFEDLRLFAALARAAQMHGAMEHVLALTADYANTRVQFGKPLAKQQAVQQQLALMAEDIAATGVAVEFATRRMGAAHPPHLIWQAIASAKIRAGEAAGKATEIAHQIHAAIGFTQEYQLQHYTRRLWAWRDEFGAESEWSRELGRRIAQRGAGQIWGALTE